MIEHNHQYSESHVGLLSLALLRNLFFKFFEAVPNTVYAGHKWRSDDLIYLVSFAVVFSWMLSRLSLGMGVGEHNDESSQIVAARLIIEGGRLYSEVFAHKGPGAVMAAWFNETLGAHQIESHRRLPAFLYLLALTAIGFSPLFTTVRATAAAATVFAGAIGAFYLHWSGQMLHYKVIASSLACIAFALVVLPSFQGKTPGRIQGFIAGIAIGFLPIMVLTYLVSAIVFLALVFVALAYTHGSARSSLNALRPILGGSTVALALTGLWMVVYGDFVEFWRFNIDFNIDVYASFFATGAINPLILVQQSLPWSNHEIDGGLFPFALFLWLSAMVYFALKPHRWPTLSWQERVFHTGLFLGSLVFWLSLDPRGAPDWHAAPLYGLALLAFAMMIGDLLQQCRDDQVAIPFTLVIMAIIWGAPIHFESRRIEHDLAELGRPSQWLSELRPSQAILFLTDRNEPVAAYPFLPSIYVGTDRLPASNSYYYLPWQAAWDEMNSNIPAICVDLDAERPPVIVLNHDPVWEISSIQDYAPCLMNIVERGYTPITQDSTRIYVRNDRLDRAAQLPFATHREAEFLLESVGPIDSDRIISQRIENTARAEYIDILVANYAGDAEAGLQFSVRDPASSSINTYNLPIDQIVDNSYIRIPIMAHGADTVEVSIRGIRNASVPSSTVWAVTPAGSTFMDNGQRSDESICYRLASENGNIQEFTIGCPDAAVYAPFNANPSE